MAKHHRLLTILLLTLSWHGLRADQAEDKAVARIQQLGGTLIRDENVPAVMAPARK